MFGEEARVRWPRVASLPHATFSIRVTPNYALHTLAYQPISTTITHRHLFFEVLIELIKSTIHLHIMIA